MHSRIVGLLGFFGEAVALALEHVLTFAFAILFLKHSEHQINTSLNTNRVFYLGQLIVTLEMPNMIAVKDTVPCPASIFLLKVVTIYRSSLKGLPVCHEMNKGLK